MRPSTPGVAEKLHEEVTVIVLNDIPGQMCNQIWSFAHFAALGLERKVRLVVPFFGGYAHLFPNIDVFGNLKFPKQKSRLYVAAVTRIFKILRKLPRFVKNAGRIYALDRNWGFEDWPDGQFARPNSITLLSGWHHRKPLPDLRPWRNDLRLLLRPQTDVCEKVDGVVALARERSSWLVGVHMRRGDFKDYADGRYYYSLDQYGAMMRSVRDAHGGGVVFLVCSNEPVPAHEWPDLDIETIPQSSSIEDWYGLTRCDALFGPISTFSMWASFYGDVPIRFVFDAKEPLDLALAEPVIGWNRLADGTELRLPDDLVKRFAAWNPAVS